MLAAARSSRVADPPALPHGFRQAGSPHPPPPSLGTPWSWLPASGRGETPCCGPLVWQPVPVAPSQPASLQQRHARACTPCHAQATKKHLAGVGSKDVTLHEVPGAYHELFFGPEKEQARKWVIEWITEHAAAKPTPAAEAADAEAALAEVAAEPEPKPAEPEPAAAPAEAAAEPEAKPAEPEPAEPEPEVAAAEPEARPAEPEPAAAEPAAAEAAPAEAVPAQAAA